MQTTKPAVSTPSKTPYGIEYSTPERGADLKLLVGIVSQVSNYGRLDCLRFCADLAENVNAHCEAALIRQTVSEDFAKCPALVAAAAALYAPAATQPVSEPMQGKISTITGHKAGYVAAIKAAAADPTKRDTNRISYIHGTGFVAHEGLVALPGAVWTRAYFERGAIEPIQERSYGIYRGRILETLNA